MLQWRNQRCCVTSSKLCPSLGFTSSLLILGLLLGLNLETCIQRAPLTTEPQSQPECT